MAKPKSSIKDVNEFMRTARERYTLAVDADKEDRTEGEEDVAFVAGDQWSPKARRRREKAKRPVQTWNRLQTFVAQVVNDGRENKPSIRTSAMDGGKKETAEFFQGRIRHLEYECDADIAYDTSREQQVVSGRGFYRVTTAYKPGKTFEQALAIEPIENQFSVLFDPTARKYDRSDADWCFIFSTLSKDAYERKYGKETAAAAANYFAGAENPAPDWVGMGTNGEMLQVAEYWLKEYSKRTLCLLADITAVYKDELPPDFDENLILDEREEDVCTVMQYIIDGVEPLSETEWLGSNIPIVPVWGKQMMVKGARRNYSLVRFAKDPQRLVNLYVSNIAEQIAQMPKTPFIGAEGQFIGREDEWETVNDDPRAFIQYKAKDINGNLVPRPERVVNEPPIQALTLGLNQAIDAIKAAMGIFDAALGAQSNETSGVAIQRRKRESDVANFHFPDNEARSRKYLGKILLELIPKIDKGAKQVPTRGEDGKSQMVPVNQPFTDPKTGQTVQHDLEDGNYDIAVATGPSYTSQRQEAFDAYSQIANNDKQFMQVAGDLLFRNMDAPGADQIADRYEKVLPAQLRPPDPQAQQNGQQQIQQAQQALQQMSQQHQQLVDQVHQLSEVIEQKQIESRSRERIAAIQSWTQLRLKGIEIGSSAAIADADREAARLEAMFDRAHEAGLALQDHVNTVLQAQQGHDAAADAQQQAQQQPPAPDQQPTVQQ